MEDMPVFLPRQGFKASSDRIRAILDSENSKGKEFSRMVVGGFSQGGAVALHTCLRSTERLAGKLSDPTLAVTIALSCSRLSFI